MESSYIGEYYVWADNRIIDFLKNITKKGGVERELIEKKNEQDGRSIRDLIEHIAVYYEVVINKPKNREEFESKEEKVSKISWEELLEYWKKWVHEFATAINNDTVTSIFTYSDLMRIFIWMFMTLRKSN